MIIKEHNKDIIDTLIFTNSLEYNLQKTCEELIELQEKLLKRLLKDKTDKNPTNQEIIDEIGDVFIRLNVLKGIFNSEDIQEGINKKLNDFISYYDKGLYIGRI